MRHTLVVLMMLIGSASSAVAQVSIGIGISLPGVRIGINLPSYPQLVRVPGYPVYYAPQLSLNFFFYDGMYWLYQSDNWYASSWYNGPWGMVAPEFVPVFVLRIPVRYYRAPPGYFRGWRSDAPPRWGEHWGDKWQQNRSGWDKWNRNSVPDPAPLPVYQRQYLGDQYPPVEQQQQLHKQYYRYQPRDPIVQQHYQEQAGQREPVPYPREQPGIPQERAVRQQDILRSDPPPNQQGVQAVPHALPPQQRGNAVQRAAPTRAPLQGGPAVPDQSQRQLPQQGARQHEQQAPRLGQDNIPQGKGASQEPRRGQGKVIDTDKDEERGQGRNR
jgi:hypothetical protein